ncbi:MAG: helix-turn-helix domain-containing protein, partial [Bacteroidetes bacterium]|nr:helix-turn-helix domain-containing protein [Bacteroidota bacterium]
NKSEAGRLLTISAYRDGVRKTNPHKHHNYLEVIFFQSGAGHHTIDEIRYSVEPPVIFLIKQERVHFLELDEQVTPKGYVLILRPEFLLQSTDHQLRRIITEVSSTACIPLSSETTINALLELIELENTGLTQVPLLESLLKALFMKIRMTAPYLPSGAHGNLHQAFLHLLEKQPSLKNTVAYYAGLLHTTPQNLNAACRKHAGMAAGDVIAVYINQEARRLLLYTSMAVSGIAFQLDFSDPSHFIRYFKRHNGATPQQYRSQFS